MLAWVLGRATYGPMALAVLLLLVGLATFSSSQYGASDGPDVNRGLGEEVAPQFLFPFVSAILDQGSQICNGALLGRGEWVLTAAHCIDLDRPQRYLVRVHAHDLFLAYEDHCTQTIAVSSAVRHPDYGTGGQWDADLCLIRLAERPRCADSMIAAGEIPRLDTADGIVPQVLSTSATAAVMLATASGWGWSWPLHGELKQKRSTLAMIAREQCSLYGVAPTSFCAAYGGLLSQDTTACFGDAGTPLFVSRQLTSGDGQSIALVGIASWGGCAIAGGLSVYTAVAAYREWILSHVPGSNAPDAMLDGASTGGSSAPSGSPVGESCTNECPYSVDGVRGCGVRTHIRRSLFSRALPLLSRSRSSLALSHSRTRLVPSPHLTSPLLSSPLLSSPLLLTLPRPLSVAPSPATPLCRPLARMCATSRAHAHAHMAGV